MSCVEGWFNITFHYTYLCIVLIQSWHAPFWREQALTPRCEGLKQERPWVERNCYMLTGGVKKGGMTPIVEKYRTQGDREEFSHTRRRHLNGAEMGYEADIRPRTNQGMPSLNHRFSPTFGPIIFKSHLCGNIKVYFPKEWYPFSDQTAWQRGPQRCVTRTLNHLMNSELVSISSLRQTNTTHALLGFVWFLQRLY